MSFVSGSSEAAAELQNKVKVTARALVDMQSEFRANVAVLKSSTWDESYEEANYYCTLVDREVRSLLPEMSAVIKRLDDYIAFIEKIDLSISGGAVSSTQTAGVPKTKETWTVTDSEVIFDNPEKTGRNMRHSQPRGDCGMCAIENMTIMAGKHVKLGDIESYAAFHKLCDKDGGTSYTDRDRLLHAVGLDSHLEDQTISGIASAVASGRGVIISVDAAKLSYYGYRGGCEPHALLVTSVVTDGNGNVTHVIVCDSNSDSLGLTGAIRYPVAEIQKALIAKRKMNVTNNPIR